MTLFEDNGPQLAACVITLTTTGFLTYGLRLYCRVTQRTWGLEDWFMTGALFPLILLSTGCLGGAFNGVGAHMSRMAEPGNAKYEVLANKWFFIFEVGYLATIIPVKISISCMLIRLAEGQKKIFAQVQYGVITVCVVMNLAGLIFICVNCIPTAATWDKTLLEKGGHCQPPQYLADFYYAVTAVNITTDWITALMPIPMVWNVQLKWNQKITIMALLSMGAFASITACIRLKYTVQLTDEVDYYFGLANLLIWGFAENGVGMTVGNIATLRPLFRNWLGKESYLSSRQRYASRPSQHSGNMPWGSNRGGYELNSHNGEFGVTKTEVKAGTRSKKRPDSELSEDDSQKLILNNYGKDSRETGITVNYHVNVTST